MKPTRRDFVKTGLGLAGAAGLLADDLVADARAELTPAFIERHKRLIEENILAAMEKIYLHDNEMFDDSFRPGAKFAEKVYSYFDYSATGISVLAHLVAKGDPRAAAMMTRIQRNTRFYQEKIHGTNLGGRLGSRPLTVPLRRLILHLALAYQKAGRMLAADDRDWFANTIGHQVELAIEHNRRFFPGETNLKRTSVNNHTAIYMQGIYYCGRIFDRPDWVGLTEEFARRMYDCIHPDGYFEEHTNEKQEGGPSLVYTRLTLGCLYDVLDGKRRAQEKFVRAGNFYRSFVNHDYQMISIADERTNCHASTGIDYGFALHSLTPQGRYFIVDNLNANDYGSDSIEHLAVLHHELDLMVTGNGAVPENRVEGNSRITLPLGVVRENRFTAGISALLALNRIILSGSHYALDQQNMVYLSHEKIGLMLIGYKSKKNPLFSTFRIGDDAFTVRTGSLAMGRGWAEATLHYRTFNAKIRWEIGEHARLVLSSDSPKTVSSTLTIVDERHVRSATPFELAMLDGFSPYSESNRAPKIKGAVFEWKGAVTIDFVV